MGGGDLEQAAGASAGAAAQGDSSGGDAHGGGSGGALAGLVDGFRGGVELATSEEGEGAALVDPPVGLGVGEGGVERGEGVGVVELSEGGRGEAGGGRIGRGGAGDEVGPVGELGPEAHQLDAGGGAGASELLELDEALAGGIGVAGGEVELDEAGEEGGVASEGAGVVQSVELAGTITGAAREGEEAGEGDCGLGGEGGRGAGGLEMHGCLCEVALCEGDLADCERSGWVAWGALQDGVEVCPGFGQQSGAHPYAGARSAGVDVFGSALEPLVGDVLGGFEGACVGEGLDEGAAHGTVEAPRDALDAVQLGEHLTPGAAVCREQGPTDPGHRGGHGSESAL